MGYREKSNTDSIFEPNEEDEKNRTGYKYWKYQEIIDEHRRLEKEIAKQNEIAKKKKRMTKFGVINEELLNNYDPDADQ